MATSVWFSAWWLSSLVPPHGPDTAAPFGGGCVCSWTLTNASSTNSAASTLPSPALPAQSTLLPVADGQVVAAAGVGPKTVDQFLAYQTLQVRTGSAFELRAGSAQLCG